MLKNPLILLTIICFLIFSTNIEAKKSENRLLLLHFDVNKTIIAEDKVKNQTVEQLISNEIAKRTVHQWDLKHPPMNYYDYVSTVLFPGPKTEAVKEKRNIVLSHFIETLKNSDFPDKSHMIALYHDCMQKMEGHYLIPSFVKFLRHLKEQEVAFRIILRTYGSDVRVGKVTEEIEKILDGDRFTYRGNFKEKTLQIEGMNSMIKTDEIYRFFRETQGHVAIQDHGKTWLEDDKKSRSGKPFVFDPEDENVLSLFIDDNINPNPESEYSIVNPLPISGNEDSTSLFHTNHLRKVDTIEAILDENYFLKLIRI